MKSRKSFRLCLICLSIIIIALSTVLAMQIKIIYAMPTSTETINLGDNGFSSANADAVDELIRELGYNSYNGLSAELDKRYDSEVPYSGTLDASNFTSSKSVTMGGSEWNIMYVSKADRSATEAGSGVGGKGDIIVTLWMADSSKDLLSTYSNFDVGYNDTYENTFPADMYGSSFIRSSLVGSPYLKAMTDESLEGQGTINSVWEPFSSTTGAFYNFLTTPAQLLWQEVQSTQDIDCGNNRPNDAYGTPTIKRFYNKNYDYELRNEPSKSVYQAWKDDKIWLPSITEVGHNGLTKYGIWNTSKDQRSHIGSKTHCWLRSAFFNGSNGAQYLYADGRMQKDYASNELAVRPAIHLNLKEVMTAAGVDPDGHTCEFKNYVYNNDATCLSDGTETATCTGCTKTDTRTAAGTALGHDFVNYVSDKNAMCTQNGTETATCTRCTQTQTRIEAGSILPHIYTTYSPNGDATCIADGTKTAQCDFGCGTTDTVTDIGSQLAHIFINYIPNNDATCNADGTKTAVCDHGCGTKDTVTDTSTQLTHVFTNYVSDNNATCNADGTKTAVCDHGCGAKDTVTDTGTQLTHSFTNYVSNGDATYTTDGTRTAVCDHGCGATDTQPDVGSMLAAVQITVTINPASSEVGEELETLTATVTSGTLIDLSDVPYTLSTDADKDVMGTYTITGTCTDDRYNITFIDGVYIVSKKADDPEGGGEIDLPVDIDVEFKVTQSSTENDYSELDGMKRGYWAQLWYRNEDGTLGDEFTDTMNCFLTLKIPNEIIEAIRGGDEINREKIANGLKVYYYVDGERYDVDNFAIAMRDDESWQIKFNYNAKFRAEVVFNAPDYKEQSSASGTPWWVWLIVGLAGAAVIGVVIVIIVVAKKKSAAAVVADNGEVLGRLDKQDEKLNEIREIVDGGFNDIVDDD